MENSLLMRAIRRETTPRPPVWLMRQAGRYMAEYREVRRRTPFLELCRSPVLAAEVMVTAVDRIGVDAAILFADLLPMLQPMGLSLEYVSGDGPRLDPPVREAADVDRIRSLDERSIHELGFVFEAVRLTRIGLDSLGRGPIPLIGFAGAPFTLASYAIEGGGSRNFAATKRLMRSDPGMWNELLGKIAESVVHYLNGQIDAGAQIVQLFDSWVGALSPDDYRTFVFPHLRTVFAGIRPTAPVIYFAAGNPSLLPTVRELCPLRSAPLGVGIDWRVPLAEVAAILGPDVAIQGNLDPTVLLAPEKVVRHETRRLVDTMTGRLGYIFNLGHGILPETPLKSVIACVDEVKNRGN